MPGASTGCAFPAATAGHGAWSGIGGGGKPFTDVASVVEHICWALVLRVGQAPDFERAVGRAGRAN